LSASPECALGLGNGFDLCWSYGFPGDALSFGDVSTSGFSFGVGSGLWLGLGVADCFCDGLGVADGLGEGFEVAFGVGEGVFFGVAFGVGDGFGVGFGVADGEGFGVGRGVTRGVCVGTERSVGAGVVSGAGGIGTGGVDCSGGSSGAFSFSGGGVPFDSSLEGGTDSGFPAIAFSSVAVFPPNEPGLIQTIFSSFLLGWDSETNRSPPSASRWTIATTTKVSLKRPSYS
jgi:hypothetical protein